MNRDKAERERGFLGAIGPAQLYVREALREQGKLSEDEIIEVSDKVAEKFNSAFKATKWTI